MTPRPTANPFKEKVITATTPLKYTMRCQLILSRYDDRVIRLRVTSKDPKLASQYFDFTTFAKPMGAIPIIHSRLPSRENCGNTNRVVKVARLSEQAPRLRYETRFTQN